MLIQLPESMPDQKLQSEDAENTVLEPNSSHAEEAEEYESVTNLNSLKESLKKSRWNVFLFLGLAFLMFGFALFPMPMDADFEYGTAEQDLGFVWGPSLGGEDLLDVPFEVTVNVRQLPATAGNITLEVYVVQIDDCTDPETASNAESRARAGNDHGYQYGFVNSPVEGKSYTFDFDLDMGQYCLNAKAVGQDGTIVDPSRTNLEVTGKLWPNQVIAGIPGMVFLGLSIFAFIGAQKVGKQVKAILEDKKVTEEQIVLEEARQQKILAGPGGPPKLTPGPAGPPTAVAGPSGAPPNQPTSVPENIVADDQSNNSSPPLATNEQAVTESTDESIFEDAGNGYYYRRFANGDYEQQIYVKDASGQYIPYQAE